MHVRDINTKVWDKYFRNVTRTKVEFRYGKCYAFLNCGLSRFVYEWRRRSFGFEL